MLRPFKATTGYSKFADGSCLFQMGNTKVLCTATIDEGRVPPHCEEKEIGWVTAEYSMLPRAGKQRTPRQKGSSGGRSREIQRLIGRSLRAVVDLKKLWKNTVIIDCDVIQADGGTRTASINGGFIAMAQAINKLIKEEKLSENPIAGYIGAVSVGLVNDKIILDLAAEDDNRAQVDMNVVLNNKNEFVEIQATAEDKTFSEKDLHKMLSLAKQGIKKLIKSHKKIVKI